MIRGFLALAFIIAAACVDGVLDRDSAQVSSRAAMEAPRPIFESEHELLRLHMPCSYIRQPAYYQQDGQVTAQNARCTNTDRRTE